MLLFKMTTTMSTLTTATMTTTTMIVMITIIVLTMAIPTMKTLVKNLLALLKKDSESVHDREIESQGVTETM